MEPAPSAPGDPAQLQFIEHFALLLTEGGFPRMPARVFACLLADDAGRLTAGELSDRLRVSPAAVSGAVRYLTQVGLVIKGREPGARRDHYRLANDLWYEVYGARNEMLTRWEAACGEGAELLGPDTPAGRRLRESQAFFAFLQAELPALMDRWREGRRLIDAASST